ncbi:hypothetical protein [Micromonospora ureilytica]|uniref:hypothetical protein n=1 Tax=Micromonospora ureilytica TaxID=709868 RepID=UPI00403A6E75
MHPFLVDEERLRSLSATRGGRVSTRGFEYQSAFASARLASLTAGAPLPGMQDVPRAIRYDWADDLDELCVDGTVVFTQCKRSSVTLPMLSKVLLGFLPKILFTEPTMRHRLRFRLVASDDQLVLANIRERALERTLVELATVAPPASDRARWMAEWAQYGSSQIICDLWDALDYHYVPDEQLSSMTAGTLYRIERQGLDLLLAEGDIHPRWQRQALDALRRLVRVEIDVQSNIDAGFLKPQVLDAADTRASLLPYRLDGPENVPFQVVNHDFLISEWKKPKVAYVARPPTWADVVHGADRDIKYVVRDQEDELLAGIEQHMLGPLMRGSDQRLPALFVLGAPGAGKTTIVRRVAARLVEQGRVLVADLGVNQGRVAPDELGSYLESLKRLSEAGRPVLAIMDDPFFAESGWDLFLERLSRPGFHNIAVLGATPAFLFDTYGSRVAGKQVDLRTFQVRSPSARERDDLARAFDHTSNAREHTVEEFLVLAMEAAAGQSFVEIIKRIWTTLNEGAAISNRTRPGELSWPVRALMIAAFFDRFDLNCPEPLMRAALAQAAPPGSSDDSHGDYIDELGELMLAEGWHIFRVDQGKDGESQGIATLHPRVAQVAWEHRPRRDFDVSGWIISASVRAPASAPQIAQFILSCQSASTEPSDHIFHKKIAAAWEAGDVPVVHLWELVDGLRLSPSRAVSFRPTLRLMMRRNNRESWLAAIQLRQLARHGSTEQAVLADNLSALLRTADLSISPQATLRLLREPRFTEAVRDRLVEALQRRLAWSPTPELVTALVKWFPDHAREELMSLVGWLTEHPEPAGPRLALIDWYQSHAYLLDFNEHRAIIEDVADWLDWGDSEKVALGLILAMAQSTSTPPLVVRLGATALRDWALRHPQSQNVLAQLLAFARKRGARSQIPLGQIATDALHWLAANPDDYHVRTVFLAFARSRGEEAGLSLVTVAADTWMWLQDHPDARDVRQGFLNLLQNPNIPLIHEAFGTTIMRLEQGLDDHNIRAAYINLISRRHEEVDHSIDQIIGDTREWLRVNPVQAHVWSALLRLLQNVGVPIDQLVAVAREWQAAQPHNPSSREQLLGILNRCDDVADIPVRTILDETWKWIVHNPDNCDVLTGLMSAVGRFGVGNTFGWDMILSEARSRLEERPEDSQLRVGLISALSHAPSSTLSPRAVVAETRGWLAAHENDTGVRQVLAAILDKLWDAPGVPAMDIVAEMQQWIRRHEGDETVEAALNAMLRRRSDQSSDAEDTPTVSTSARPDEAT